MEEMKLVVVGDGEVGKTCILAAYVQNTFIEEHVPTIFDNTLKEVTVDGITVKLTLWDTEGQAQHDRVRCNYSHIRLTLREKLKNNSSLRGT